MRTLVTCRRAAVMDTAPPVSRPHRGEDRRADLGERAGDLTPIGHFRALAALEDLARRAADACPPEQRLWLSAFAAEVLAGERDRVGRIETGGLRRPPDYKFHPFLGLLEVIERDGPRLGTLRFWSSERGDSDAIFPAHLLRPLVRAVLASGESGVSLHLALKALHVGADAETVLLLRSVVDRGGADGYRAAVHLTQLSHAAEGYPEDFPPGLDRRLWAAARSPAAVGCLLAALTADWPDEPRYKPAVARRAADVAAQLLAEHFPPEVLDRGQLRAALAEYAGGILAHAVRLWWSAGGGYDDCPVSLLDAVRDDPTEWERFYWTCPAADFPPTVVARSLAATDPRPYDAREFGRFLDAIQIVGEAPLPADEVLPALVGAVHHAGESFPEVDPALAECWSGFLARLPERRSRWTEWDAWLAALLGRPLGELGWLVFADWLEENGHELAAAVARGDTLQHLLKSFRDRATARGWQRVFEWVVAADPLTE